MIPDSFNAQQNKIIKLQRDSRDLKGRHKRVRSECCDLDPVDGASSRSLARRREGGD
jgi:hypothetical protein